MDETEFIEQVQNIPTQARLILDEQRLSTQLAENVHAMPIPVRPAKLRALIIQLQKDVGKINRVVSNGNHRLCPATHPKCFKTAVTWILTVPSVKSVGQQCHDLTATNH